MHRIHRQGISGRTTNTLARITKRVLAAEDPKAEADRSWEQKPRVAFGEIRAKLLAMAQGRARCMYCEDSMGTDIDHFWPKAGYPEHAFVWCNYLLACSYCNSNMKRNEFPRDADTGQPLLIDPAAEDPADHLELLPASGKFEAKTVKGAESIRVFGLNDHESPRRLPKGRRDTLIALIALLKEFDAQVVAEPQRAAEIKSAILDFPFSAVLSWAVRLAAHANGALLLGADVAELFVKHAVDQW